MAWRTIDINEVRLTPQEMAALNAISGSASIGQQVLTNVVGEFLDTIAAVGTPLGAAGAIPDRIRPHVINRTRWLWLCEFPTLKVFQTADRSKLNDDAVKMIADINDRTVKVPPGDSSAVDQTASPAITPRPLRIQPCDQDGI